MSEADEVSDARGHADLDQADEKRDRVAAAPPPSRLGAPAYLLTGTLPSTPFT